MNEFATFAISFDFPALVKRRRHLELYKNIPFSSINASVEDSESGDSVAEPDAQHLTKCAPGAFECSLAASHAVDSLLVETDADRIRAECELVRVFKQEWFAELQIIGQFNLGFIVCLLNGKDLFIVDQHASDEKFNFEDLQASTVIQTQQLLRPLALDVAAEDELLVIENLGRFRAGGFEIEHRPANPPTRRLYLRSQPSSKRTMFVIDDLREMIATLKASGGIDAWRKEKILRPSRVRAMFASRACRKSVMIGTALSLSQMGKIVRNLGGLNSPWFCPHGRYVNDAAMTDPVGFGIARLKFMLIRCS
jgi:DNA mismatch repair ATPase MutL